MRRIHLTNKSKGTRKGFTVVELTVAIVILGILFPMFTFLIVTMYKDSFYLDDKVKKSTETMQALWYMDDNVRIANSFMAQVPSNFTDAYGPNNLGTAGAQAWSYKGSSATSRALIIRNYATSTNALNTGRMPVFVNTPEYSCSTQMYYQPQLTYTAIFFTKDNTLYRRVLTDKTATLCAGNAQQQKQTCPPYITSGRHASCEANDEVLATQVTNFSLAYYTISQAGTSTQLDPNYTSSSPTILQTADYVIVTITTSTRNGAVTNTLTQRMTKVN